VTTLESFLKERIEKDIELVINDNRSTMLSVQWGLHKTKVRLHRIFLEAPRTVKDDLALYLKKRKRLLPISVKAYIREASSNLDYSHEVDKNLLVTKGEVYEIQERYKLLNRRYFDDSLHLAITWYGDTNKKRQIRVTLGQYIDTHKLVKIHRLLDNKNVPSYVLDYVIYHEMVHAVCPPYVDAKGVTRIHTTEFKQREKCFVHYDSASDWLKENREKFFTSIF
jgi:hypothetical protein